MSKVKVNLDFKDIKYTVNKKKETIPIVRGVSGTVEPGEMLCLLGPSGSGKTSLVQIICRRLVNGPGRDITGEITCNGRKCTPTEFQRISGLVTQEDVFNGMLSVAETLKFSAQLKLPSGIRKERVDKVVAQLQLEKCLQTRIGDDTNVASKGISGGEKRRLAIALEILNPDISILVLDEPTSGLDAAAALNVANILRTLADTGITVATTLHQPRDAIMKRFEKLMVLAAGQSVYYGPVAHYIPYLENELQCEVPVHASPYDLLLDVLNPAIGLEGTVMHAVKADKNDVADTLASIFAQSALQKANVQTSTAGKTLQADNISGGNQWTANWVSKFCTILNRTFLIKLRDPIVLVTQISSAIMMGVIFGILYWQLYDRDAEYVIHDTQMAVTMNTVMIVFLPYDVTLTFPKERQIFLRERKAGLYSTSAFYCARITCDMPFHILAAVIMSLILYGMAGLQSALHLFLGINIIAILVGAALMQMIGAISKNFEEANLLMMLIMILSMVMSSSFVRDIPDFLKWLREISVMGIAADMGMYVEFQSLDAKYGTLDEVLEAYTIQIRNDDDFRVSALILACIYMVARIVTYLAVKFVYTGRSFAENLRD